MEDVDETTSSSSQPSVSSPSALATSATRSAPAPPPSTPPPSTTPPSREALVRTAVEFLQSPRVSTASEEKKRLFLKSKSLTDEEVEAAVAVASAVPSHAAAASLVHDDDEEEWRQRDGACSRRRQRLSPIGLTLTLVLVGGFSYGIYTLYVRYVLPFLKRQKRVDEKLLWLEASTRDLQDNVALTLKTMQNTVEKLQASFNVQRETTTTTEMEANLRRNQTQLAAEVKSEIASLKKMLLNVNNFPPPSSRATEIPFSLDEEKGSSSPSAATAATKTTNELSVVDEIAATASPPAWQLEASTDDSHNNGVGVVVVSKTSLDDDVAACISKSEPFLTSAAIDATADTNSDDAVVDEKPPVVIVKEDVVRRGEQWSSGSSNGSSSSSGTSATSFEVIETKDCGSLIASKKSCLNAIHAESEGSDGDDEDNDGNCSVEDRVEINEESGRVEINTTVHNLIDDVLEKGSKEKGAEKEETDAADDAVHESAIN